MKAISFITLVTTLIFVEAGKAGPLNNWSLIKPSQAGVALYAIAYGNGQFVAVGYPGVIRTSVDGANWVQRESGTTDALTGIVFANGQFAIVGKRRSILTSANGVDWGERQPTAQNFNHGYGIAYGNGQFVAVGFDGIQTSADGTNWVQRQTGALRSIAFANGQFVAVGDDGFTLTSTDAIHWTSRLSPLGEDSVLAGVGYGDGQFVAVGLRYITTSRLNASLSTHFANRS